MQRWSCVLFVAAVACDASLQPSPVTQREGNGPLACDAGDTARVPDPQCVDRCCPKAPECYPLGNPSPSSGAECLAMIDNTGKARRQYRQTMSVSTAPPAFAASGIADILVHASGLKSAACGTPIATSGFIQLIDFDHANNTSRVGFAAPAPDLPTAAAQGLCFVEGRYDDPANVLDSIPVPAGWPDGLPPPMSLPWDIKVVTAFRYTEDFDLATSRAQILARFAPGGDLAGRFNGIFYYDEARGYMHGYSPLVYILAYLGPVFNAIPLREAEIKQQLNDPEHPNCAGTILGDNPELSPACEGTSLTRLWGCPKGKCSSKEFGPTSVHGYFLLTELEQVFNDTLGQTLCNVIPGAPYPGFPTDKKCRDSARWNLADPVNGLPPGDWCAATNSKANPSCHDAFESVSFSTFQAFPIRDGVCPPR